MTTDSEKSGGSALQAGPPLAIQLQGISKRFGAVLANSNINLNVEKGKIHGIIGENGAGKSTLMSILYGFYEADEGEINVDGRPLNIKVTQDAIHAGIGMVHQHFMLVDTFSVLENVILGAEAGPMLVESLTAARTELERLEREYGLEVDPNAIVGELPVGVQQRVEILKSLFRGAKILILDEPTGVLTPQETDQLFEILKSLKAQGVTILLITHKLREIMAITDNVSVMRGGEMVAHRKTTETDEAELAELMVGRKVLLRVEKKPSQPGDTKLEVTGLTVHDDKGVKRVDDVYLDVRAGEIVGIAGVSGNGQSELLSALSGITPIDAGEFTINTHVITASSSVDPHQMRANKVAHVPEDRLRMGLIRQFRASESFILGYQDDNKYNNHVLFDMMAIEQDCAQKMADYDVRPPDPELRTANFSGGNQQKIVLARDMERAPEVLLVGQPTRGVDIGAIEFIHKSLIEMRDRGCAVLLVSVELDEIMSLSDRILVMFDGHIVGEVSPDDADERSLGLMMANIVPDDIPVKLPGAKS
jgi:simple sugar transport system ATP-binding protein